MEMLDTLLYCDTVIQLPAFMHTCSLQRIAASTLSILVVLTLSPIAMARPAGLDPNRRFTHEKYRTLQVLDARLVRRGIYPSYYVSRSFVKTNQHVSRYKARRTRRRRTSVSEDSYRYLRSLLDLQCRQTDYKRAYRRCRAKALEPK